MKTLGLYIHIPFCVKKCHYCDFLSAPATKQVQNLYMDVLQREIREKANLYREYVVDSIFFGGGTPTSVPYEALSAVMETIKESFVLDTGCEITTECNPGTVTYEALCAYKKAGINRLSIGLQSTENELLKVLGRIHTYEQFLDTLSLAKKAGFENINVDLMSALPNQTLGQYEDTLKKVTALGVHHISAYSLIVEEGTRFYDLYEKDRLTLPSEEEERNMYYLTEEILGAAGFQRYEISNYAKEGFESRHNLKYWTRQPYIGFGLGASTFFDNIRYKNTSDLSVYLEKEGYRIQEETEQLSIEESMEEFMFLGLRCIEGVSKKAFYECFQKEMASVYGEILCKLEKNELIKIRDDKVYLTKRGIDVSNMVLANFLF